ncbi:MAG: SAM-dependent methyltransferases [uncultured Craurococcus sp.]|uniref:SAM-dependent methyltransferases n=1 Tax=uncultured Craurococcus sp. TaxID=1135998 RepID=A0A6J4IJR3_9PROT|nr:MAG: SAM-dependent methyltransferases [uncultured Craurococcus sp.]
MTDPRRHAPATLRNREPLLATLRRHLPAAGLVLEIASGTGEHAAFLAAALPGLAFRPTERDPDALPGIDAWAAGLPNIRPAILLDATEPGWPAADAVLCVNMIHIAPWAATLGLVRGAAASLAPGGPLILYGPFRRGGAHTAPGNAAFDADLRARDPAFGLRDLEAVAEAAAAEGFAAPIVEPMPANNLTLVFHRS